MKRLLVYGGAFDPPHLGHELLLKTALEYLKPDRALVIPSAVSPHKRASGVKFHHRADMCRCFLKLSPAVRVSLIEYGDPGERSYTKKTLARLRRAYPGWEIYLLLGGDMLSGFKLWSRWRRILAECTLLAAVRSDGERGEVEKAAGELVRAGGRVELMPLEPIEISSSELRAALAASEDCSRYLEPSVAQYIGRFGLYGKSGGEE